VSFVRYADDIAIYASSQRSAERIKESVIRWLSKELKLEVNRAKSGAGPTEQSGLLGFRIDQEGNIEIGEKAIQRLKERVRELWDALQGKTSEELRRQWQQYVVELLPPSGEAKRNRKPQRLDSPPHPQVLLATLARKPGTRERSTTLGRPRADSIPSQMDTRSMENGSPLCHAEGT
jgi:hypothetical protein